MAKRKDIEGFNGGLYQPYGPYQRYGIIFGEGRRVRENNINWRADYVSRDTLGKALVQGWRNGCPIPYEVIFEIYKSPEKALNRYLDVNDTFEEAVLELSTVRPRSSITRQLLEHVGRERGETKYLHHEPENVPDRHLDRIAPLGHSYALPRVLIDIREKALVQGEARHDLEYTTLLDAATVSQNRLELLARVGEGAIRL